MTWKNYNKQIISTKTHLYQKAGRRFGGVCWEAQNVERPKDRTTDNS